EKKLKNLIPFKKNDPRTKRLQSKGGKSKSAKKAFANALRNRIWCRPNCGMFFTCPFQAASAKKFNGKCALKEMPDQIQNWTVDILLNGSDGMITSMRSMILDIMIEAKSGSLRDRIKALYALKDVHEAAYGKFTRQETTGSQEITVRFKDPYRGKK
ncbi:MAG: hypothetical protein KKD77_23860, partial [Gammaproteobacteria bacterium]|nr:hypothetical protein [Gammaproteobacteria bacterium]